MLKSKWKAMEAACDFVGRLGVARGSHWALLAPS